MADAVWRVTHTGPSLLGPPDDCFQRRFSRRRAFV